MDTNPHSRIETEMEKKREKVKGKIHKGKRSSGAKNQAEIPESAFLLWYEIEAEEGNENLMEIWIFQLIWSFCTKYLYLSSLVEAL